MGKQPLYRLAQGEAEGQSAQQKPHGLGHADIPAADAEGQSDPDPEHRCHKKAVGQGGEPGAEGAQQFVHRPQSKAVQQSGGELPRGEGYRVHLNSRLAQPPRCLGSS